MLLLGLWLRFSLGGSGMFSCLNARGLNDLVGTDPIHSFKFSRDIRRVSSTSRHFLMNALRGSEILSESLNLTGILVILSMSSFYVLHSQGVSPCSISYAMTPMDQISFLRE